MTLTKNSKQVVNKILTKLSIHPDWRIPDHEIKIYKSILAHNPPLEKGHISIQNFGIAHKNDQLIISAFISNTTNRICSFGKIPLLLLGPRGEKVAIKIFDLKQMGEISPMNSRPWHFIFSKKDLLTEKVPEHGLRLVIALQSRKNHRLDLDNEWESFLSENDKNLLIETIKKLPPLKTNEINITGLNVVQTDNKDLIVTLLIRNGISNDISIHKLPLFFEDASGTVIAKGSFKLKSFEVKANTTKPLTVLFPKSMITQVEIDLSKWKVYTNNSLSS